MNSFELYCNHGNRGYSCGKLDTLLRLLIVTPDELSVKSLMNQISMYDPLIIKAKLNLFEGIIRKIMNNGDGSSTNYSDLLQIMLSFPE